MSKLPYDQRLEYGFQHGFWDGVVEGTVAGPGKIVSYQTPGARVPEPWRDFDFKVQSYNGRGAPYPIGSTITLRAGVGEAVINGVHRVRTLDAGEAVIQPGDHLLVFYAPGEMGGGNSATRLIAATAASVDVVRDGTVYAEGRVPPGVPPALPQPLEQFLGHFRT